MSEAKKNDIQSAVDVGLLIHADRPRTDSPYTIIPEGARVHSLEELLADPVRKRGIVQVHDPASLIAYVKKHQEPGTLILADKGNVEEETDPRIVAVLNHHDGDGAGWGDHRCMYTCPFSEPWKIWLKANKQAFTQYDFAEFLEDNIPDIADPPGAQLKAACAAFTARKKLDFHQATRLTDGTVDFEYRETMEGGGQLSGKVNLPELFVLGLAPFEGFDKYEVAARLRWRIDPEARTLRFFYALEQPERVVDTAFGEICKKVGEETERPVLYGRIE
jgi:uncharacterized protein YfdQ (DUF2303 family)